ncbi:MAG: hypothetical protein ACRDJN_21385, partial [Chloroflexota bacterium]
MSVRPSMQGYLWLVLLAAGGLLVYWLRAWHGPAPTDVGLMLVMVGLAVAAQHFPLTLTPQYKMDLSIAAYFACLLLFGAPGAMLLVGLSQVLGQATLGLRRHPVSGKRLRSTRVVLFNTGQLMLATGLGGLAYYAFLPHFVPAPLGWRTNLWALPAAATSMYLGTSLTVAVMVGLQSGRSPASVWLSVWRLDALESAGLFLVGLVAALCS